MGRTRVARHLRGVATAGLATIALLTSACSGSGGDAARVTSAPPETTAEIPSAVAAWELEDDPSAAVGDADLRFDGGHALSGAGAAFDGASGGATTAGPAPVDTTGPFAVAAWASLHEPRLEGGAQLGAAVSQTATSAMTFYLGVADGRWTFTMKESDSDDMAASVRASGGTATPGSATWVHLVGVHDPGAGLIHLYVDGEQVAETGFTTPWRSDGPLVLGRGQIGGAPAVFFPGALADVRLYDETLEQEQVDALFEATRPTIPPPPPPGVPDDSRIPAGEYAYTYTAEESARLQELFGAEAQAAGFPGTAEVRLRFSGNQWQQFYVIDGVPYLVGGVPEGDGGTYSFDGNLLVLSNRTGVARYEWSTGNGTLTLELVRDPAVEAEYDIVSFVMAHEYQRVDGP